MATSHQIQKFVFALLTMSVLIAALALFVEGHEARSSCLAMAEFLTVGFACTGIVLSTAVGVGANLILAYFILKQSCRTEATTFTSVVLYSVPAVAASAMTLAVLHA